MDAGALGRYIDARFHLPGHRLFRLEVLPFYAVDSDGDDFRRWLDGAAEPSWERKGPWLDTLRREHANQQVSSRVRILSEALTTYERYSCEFGYAYNVEAGEDIRVLHRGEHTVPTGLVENDFWLINDDIAVAMSYDDQGRFDGARIAEEDTMEAYLRTRDAAWSSAEPFARWWARHPELHRTQVATRR